MKVFISVSKCFNYRIEGERWRLTDSIKKYLDKLISNETEILIGDCEGLDYMVQLYLHYAGYKNVTVYVSGSKKGSRNNVGNWTEKRFQTDGEYAYIYRLEKDIHMAEDADFGFAIWDGESKGTYINMLYLLALGKQCRLYLAKEDSWIDINSLDELGELAVTDNTTTPGEYTGEYDSITHADIRAVLTRCGFSDEMITYIISEKAVSLYQLADVICRAPVTLDEKMYLIRLLIKKRNIKYEAYCSVYENIKQGNSFFKTKNDLIGLADIQNEDSIWTYLKDLYDEIRTAKDELFAFSSDMIHNRALYLFEEWYDADDQMEKSCPCGLFATPEAVEQYIRNEESDRESDEESNDIWYRSESWNVCDTDWKNPMYEYYYNPKGQVCWFKKLIPKKQEHGNTYYTHSNRQFTDGNLDLDISTPYRPGDIVLIDCRPFGPPFHAMILEAKNQWDCCFPNIVFRIPFSSKWRLTPLKHKRFYIGESGLNYEPILSPLYRIRKVKEKELTKEDDRLLELSSILSGSEEKAEIIWNNWSSDEVNWKMVKRIFN